MKKKIAMSIGCLMLAGLSGCCNIITRVEGEFAPYACAPHPYYCTAEVWPDVALSRTYLCGTVFVLARAMWPISVVDESILNAFDATTPVNSSRSPYIHYGNGSDPVGVIKLVE